MRWYEFMEGRVDPEIDRIEKKVKALQKRSKKPPRELEEVNMPPLSAPDPKTREIEAADKAIELAHRRKKQVRLKDMETKVQKARTELGHMSPTPPKPSRPPHHTSTL